MSVITTAFNLQWAPLSNINLFANILAKQKTKDSASIITPQIPVTASVKGSAERMLYNFSVKDRITSFYIDTSPIAIKNFIAKLHELKKGKRKKLRIAFCGDSMCEGDMITQTLRKLLQQEFGGYGVGFVPVNSVVKDMRVTVRTSCSDNWQEEDFRTKQKTKTLYISGHVFTPNGNAWMEAEDKTTSATALLEKYLLFGYAVSTSINYNNSNILLDAKSKFNKQLLDNAAGNKLKISVDNNLPVFGISFESPNGIVLDNYSFRGTGGIEFAKMDSSFLATISKNNTYDLIVLQYGVNLMGSPNDTKFNWYYTAMKNAVMQLRKGFNNTDILMISAGDRAFRYADGTKTATALPAIITMQQKIAFETGSSFYNLFSSMGGEGSIVKWVNEKPALAYKDYTHPTEKGSEIIAKSIYNAIMYEYNKPEN